MKHPHPTILGTLSVNLSGFGFVKADDGTSVFIPPGYLGGAISGDTVEVDIDAMSDPMRPSGFIARIVARRFSEFVGCLVPYRGGWAIRPLRRELPAFLPLDPASCAKARPKPAEGVWAVAELPIPADPDGIGRAILKSTIGESGDVTADLDAIVHEYHLPEQYTEAEEREAAALQPLVVHRRDCKRLCCVTIDPVDARDYDDALSCEPGKHPDEVVVGVHIADVACYVRRGSRLDQAARARAFTSYLPGRTIPMLPRALANVQCSLQAGVPRLAHTVFIRFNRHTGDILGWERCHTTICVRQRLCYEQVQQYLDGGSFEAEEGVLPLLDRLSSLAALLRHHRQFSERFLPMEMPEIRAICSGEPPKVLGVQANADNPSHQLVEEFMLAANQCVAEELLKRSLPGIFRNHLPPDVEKLREFVETATILLGKPVRSLSTRASIVHFLRLAGKSPLRDVLLMNFLRHLPRADYGAECTGHFGLGKEHYCHFTSPIRRYADTLVHQQLLALDAHRKPYGFDAVAELAAHCSAQEVNCDQAEFAAQDRLKIRLIAKEAIEKEGFTVEAEVCRVTKAGLQLYLPAYGLVAFANDEQLPRSRWTFDARRLVWQNRRTGQQLAVAARGQFSVDVADPVRGELRLCPEEDDTSARRRRHR